VCSSDLTDVMLAHITAETLGVRPEDVTVVLGDTAITPWDVGSHASRTTFVAGNAARLAAEKAKRRILEMAAAQMHENVEDLELRDGFVFRKDAAVETIPFAKVVRAGHFRPAGEVILAEAWYDPPNEMQDEKFHGNISAAWSFAAQAAEVEVDVETGRVRVLRVVSAHDIGRAINPMGAEGQIEGGIAIGMGYALSEELLMREGQVMNPTFLDYRIATAKDMPKIEVIFVETNDPAGPFGAKGLGELCTIPTAPAIANAIYDAVGVRLTQLPMTAERVLRAIRGNEYARC
jgi:xanthine dehydrogenase molybdenum-binding subunit